MFEFLKLVIFFEIGFSCVNLQRTMNLNLKVILKEIPIQPLHYRTC